MATDKDRLPKSRAEQLAMADGWISVCVAKQTDWNIPVPALTELAALRNAVRTALETVKNESTRTPVANARRKDSFDAQTGFMRGFKRRRFLSPPLTDSDYVSLGIKPHDEHSTPSTAPTA
ncbi:MAG: hypothetical protein LBK73_01135 [Treponema sp.]|nr:hypothetical protein [Treponema sp.]